MKVHDHELFSVNFTFIGNFNPSIIHPQWLVNKGLIGESEGEGATVDVVHPSLSRFQLPWFYIEVRPTRFELRTFQSQYIDALKDLAISIFRILGDTPIEAFGVNYNKHYFLEGPKQYEDFGYAIAPVNKVFDFLETPRLFDINITTLTPETKNSQYYINMKIYPSDLINPYGVAINVNNHYVIDKSGRDAAVKLKEIWPDVIVSSENKIINLWKNL